MTQELSKHIDYNQIRQWLFTYANSERLFQSYYQQTGQNYSVQMLFENSGKSPQSSIGFEANTDFRSINNDYSYLKETLQFSETDWFHPFFDVSIRKHLRYFPPFTHHHSFFEVCYVLNGCCIQTIFSQGETSSLNLKTGDILIIPPGLNHSILMNSDSVVSNILIRKSTFEAAFLSNIPPETVLYNFFLNTLYNNEKQNYIICHTGTDKSLEEIFFSIADEYCNNQIYANNIINQMLSIFFSKLLRNYSRSIEFAGDSSRCLELIPSILQYLETNFPHTNIQDIANHFNFNPSYLGHIFKENTGTTLVDALIRVRIAKATELLQNTSLSVDLITEMVGYSDTTYFIRIFKKQTGSTPLQYRKQFDR